MKKKWKQNMYQYFRNKLYLIKQQTLKFKIVFCVCNPFYEIHSWFLTTWIWNHITHLILRHRCDGILEYKLFQTELWPQNSEPNQTKDIGGRETMLWIFSFRFSREHCSLTLFLRIFPFFLLFFFPLLELKAANAQRGSSF